jgi:hypothetical protein
MGSLLSVSSLFSDDFQIEESETPKIIAIRNIHHADQRSFAHQQLIVKKLKIVER